MVVFLIAMFILLLGIGVALPNCLSLALVDFQDVIGTAGALFSLGYYVIVTMTILGMSQLHTGSLLVMPLYFLVIVVIMVVFTRYLSLVSKLRNRFKYEIVKESHFLMRLFYIWLG